MKIVFIIISRGIIARNILRTGVLENLLKDENVRIVLFLPNNPPEYFKKEFEHPRVIMENTGEGKLSWMHKKFILPFVSRLVYTKSTWLFSYCGTPGVKRKKTLSRGLEMGIYGILSRFVSLKRAARRLEMLYFGKMEKKYAGYFEKYSPDLVFSTSILGKVDIAFLKIAKKRKIKNVSMMKGWDSADQRLFRVKPDKFFVTGEALRKRVAEIQDIREEDILITGFPQFDIYEDKSVILPREEFFKKIGLDPNKKLIFFGSEGLWGGDEEEIAEILRGFAADGRLAFPASLVIRPHFSDFSKSGNSRFHEFEGREAVYLDNKNHRLTTLFLDSWDASREDMAHFANMIYHSDIIISTCSTLSLDGAMFNKPIISIAFDVKIKKHYQSVLRRYDFDYFAPVLNSGGTRLAKSPEELRALIDLYLKNPETDAEGRKKIIEALCCKKDGLAASRMANYILEMAGAPPLEKNPQAM